MRIVGVALELQENQDIPPHRGFRLPQPVRGSQQPSGAVEVDHHVRMRRADKTMRTGFWNIPASAERHALSPDLVLAPLVGFDREKYRLGYGGGYFDRTLASLDRKLIVIRVGYEFSEIETIFPSRTISAWMQS
jgi:5-formyltetrahydrofolate cyclo-ligase